MTNGAPGQGAPQVDQIETSADAIFYPIDSAPASKILDFSAHDGIACEQCHEPFEPRVRSGGRPQRFCNSKCRMAFHQTKAPTLAPTLPTLPTKSPTLPPTLKPAERPIAQSGPADDEFDWQADDEDIVVKPRDGVAVYWHQTGEVVIREQGQYHPDDDRFVRLTVESLPSVIRRLQEMYNEQT